MGSAKDIMELFAERDLRQYFTEFDGWTMSPMTGMKPDGRFFRFTRGKWVGVETAYVAVSFDPVPGDEFINAFTTLPDGHKSLTKKFLLTPQATDTSLVPPHIRILLMNAFAFSGGDLVWLTKKKNSIQFPAKEALPVGAAAKPN